MKTNKTQEALSKLQVIKELSPEKSVQQVCEVLIDYINSENKEPMGFKSEDSK